MNPNGHASAVLTVRAQPNPESTDLASKVFLVWPACGFVGGKSFVVFIHGFNDDYVEARYSYAAFRGLLSTMRFPAEVIEFHWPGNVGKTKWLSTEAYPGDIAPALASGSMLAEWIQQADPEARFVLVGHSLGCRVALSAIRTLRANGQLSRIASAALMAAAVPVEFITPDNLGPNASDGLQWLVLHSTDDDVLKWAFPIGETAGGQGFFPQAVGRFGHPTNSWIPAYSSQDMGYGHNDYWFGGRYEAPSDGEATDPPDSFAPLAAVTLTQLRDNLSANIVARLLGAAPPAAVVTNSISSTGSIPANKLPCHVIGQSRA